MNAQELISELSRQGAILKAENNELQIDAPKDVLTSELRQELVEHKQAILTLLSPPPIAAAPTVPSVHKSLMYENAKTWNPAVGCEFACVYCEATFKRIVAWSTKQRGENCSGCLTYRPHEHPERLSRIPNEDIIFAFGNGDIAFYREEFVEKAINELMNNLRQSKKNKTVYLQSKDPKCFERYIDKLKPIADSVVLLTTLETNRDAGYADISKAPLPSIRYKDFLALEWKRKVVTVEPVLNFDLRDFVDWICEISPEIVYLGFNSKPDAIKLPEPSTEKFWDFYDALSEFTKVKLKDTRGNRPRGASTPFAFHLKKSCLDLDAPPRRLYMDAEREEIIAEILRLERKHIQEGLHYDRVRYLGDNTLNRRKEFLLDYLYSLCDHFENYTIGIHDLATRWKLSKS